MSTLRTIHPLLLWPLVVFSSHASHHTGGTRGGSGEGVRAVEGGPAMGRERRLRKAHGVMVGLLLKGGKWCRRLRVAHLRLLLLLAALCSLHDLCGTVLVGWVIEKRADVVHKQGVQQLGDLLLVGEIQSSLKRNPAAPSETTRSSRILVP